MTRRVRFSGHEAFNSVLRADWIQSIKLSIDRFDASLYRVVEPKQDDTDEDYEQELAPKLDVNQSTLSYADPVLVPVVDCPDEQDSFFLTDDNAQGLGESIEPLLLRIGDLDVPRGSVLEWDEEDATGERTVWWYVHKSMGFGTANVGVIYICIPMRDFSDEGLAEAVAAASQAVEEPVIDQDHVETGEEIEELGVMQL